MLQGGGAAPARDRGCPPGPGGYAGAVTRIVLAAGGTGGHIYPAAALAAELQRRQWGTTLLGQRGGMEERIAAERRLRFEGVRAGKFERGAQGGARPRELLAAAQGLWQARRTLARLRPVTVVGFGGFASLPGVLAAQSLGIPTVLHEQNAFLGLTQRLALRRARLLTTAYAGVRGAPETARLVGMPVREERRERAAARAELGLDPGALTVLVMGGSQGSLPLNRALPRTLLQAFPGGRTRDGRPVQVLHSTGPAWLDGVRAELAALGVGGWYHPHAYLDAVAAWSAADLAVTRAGTGTLAEAAYHGVPLVMVPLPHAADDHQRFNARSVQAAGAGVLAEQAELALTLPGLLAEFVEPAALQTRRAAALRLSPEGAAARLADLVVAVATGEGA